VPVVGESEQERSLLPASLSTHYKYLSSMRTLAALRCYSRRFGHLLLEDAGAGAEGAEGAPQLGGQGHGHRGGRAKRRRARRLAAQRQGQGPHLGERQRDNHVQERQKRPRQQDDACLFFGPSPCAGVPLLIL
jgi:hypothetical protein